jgi:hypothetical protein
VAQSHKYQDEVGNPIVSNQLQEISSPESMTNRRRDIIGSIQPKFVYQFAFLDYYEPMENWEVNENTNVDVFEKINEIYSKSSEYAKAQMNVLDEILKSYSHQGNLELDQTKYIAQTRDHEYVYLEMIRLLSRVYAFCEEEGHVIMDCPFLPFHIRAGIARHVEL